MKEIPKLQTAFLPLIYNRELNMATSLPIDRTYNVRFPYNINVTKKRTHFASKSPRTSRRALNVLPYYINAGDLITAAIGPLNVASPGQHYRAFKETDNIADHFRSVVRGNSGWTSELFAKEHPVLSLGSNLVGDAISGAAIAKAPGVLNTLIRMDMPRYGFTPTTDYYFKPGYLGMNSTPIGKIPKIPEGYTFIRELMLNGQLKHIVKDPNGKFKVLEDLNTVTLLPKVNLRNYHGEKLTGNEEGFDLWALSLQPETDHFANLSHGLNNEQLLPIMNREFEALPNGSRVDLGEIFSSDSSSNLLLYVRRNNKRIKMVLPKNPDEMVSTNEYGTRGADAARIFNELLDKLLDLYGYSPTAVSKAVYNLSTNTLSVPKLSFIKLYKKGNKFKKYGINI